MLSDLIGDNPQIRDIDLIYPNQVVYINESIPTPPNKVLGASTETEEVYAQAPTATEAVISLSDSEIALLSQLIHSEAKGESYEGKVAVGNVVLARMLDDQFPNSLSGVIYQRNQFSVVNNGSINKRQATKQFTRHMKP